MTECGEGEKENVGSVLCMFILGANPPGPLVSACVYDDHGYND